MLIVAIILGIVALVVVKAPEAILQTLIALVWVTMALTALGAIAYDLLR